MTTDLQPTVEISRFGLAIWRRWRMIALCVISLLVAACAWLVLGPSSVTATTEVTVNVISTDPFTSQRTSSELIDPATEQQLIKSSEVLDRTASKLGDGATAGSILRGLDTEVIPASTVVRISWTGSDAAHAQVVADTLAEEYLDYRGELARERQQETLAPLNQRRDSLIDQLRQASSGRTTLLNELNLVYSQITDVSSLATSGGTVLTRAADTTPSASPDAVQVLAAALVLGLLLGTVIAVVDDIVRRRVHDASDVAAGGGGPMLARLRARSAAELAEPEDRDALQTVWHRQRHQVAVDVPVILVIGASVGAPVVEVARALELAANMVDAAGLHTNRRPRAVPVPAEEGYAVALSLAPRAHVVVLAAEAGRTPVRKLAILVEHLRAIGVEPAGTVVAHRFTDTTEKDFSDLLEELADAGPKAARAVMADRSDRGDRSDRSDRSDQSEAVR
ncbi:Wzz/FepE/Etk N-terminal domain-containing protein [Nocardioides panacisoli]|uniref:Polysaccharide chain length determinant N-terminal domain-containing protein n=1 Tax=Nocardioides panacisoli TaxID=627624 RepID=A0ABP7IHQ4_9ACTN